MKMSSQSEVAVDLNVAVEGISLSHTHTFTHQTLSRVQQRQDLHSATASSSCRLTSDYRQLMGPRCHHLSSTPTDALEKASTHTTGRFFFCFFAAAAVTNQHYTARCY